MTVTTSNVTLGNITRQRSRPRRHPDRAVRREELLDAAIAVIRRDGPSPSMTAIATEAGITKPILYRHFGDRDGMAAALAARFATDLRARLTSALTAEAGPRDLLVSTVDAYLRFVEDEPNVYRFLVRQTLEHEPRGFIGDVASGVAVVLGEQLRAEGADSGPAEVWAYGIVGFVHMAGDWWADRRTMPRARLVEYLASLLWSGLSGQTRENS